jgi:transporter family protein
VTGRKESAITQSCHRIYENKHLVARIIIGDFKLSNDWIIYLLLTILSWGVWMFLPKIALRTISIESALVFEILGGIFFGLVLFGFVNLDFHVVGTLCAAVAGFCSYLGVYYYMKTVKLNPVGLTASIASLYPVVTVVLGVLVLGERASLKRILGIILAMIAIYLMSLPKTEKGELTKKP